MFDNYFLFGVILLLRLKMLKLKK